MMVIYSLLRGKKRGVALRSSRRRRCRQLNGFVRFVSRRWQRGRFEATGSVKSASTIVRF